MSTEFTIEPVFRCDAPVADVIFVHGLTGDPHKTWTTQNGDAFWPPWLQCEFHNISLYTLGYPARVFAKWAGSEMDLFERAENILEAFAGRGIGTRPLVFIAHSLGGILVKILLRKSHQAGDQDWQSVSNATKLVIFLSTPHTGASIARVLELFPRSSPNIALLANKTGFLQDLNAHYRHLANSQPDLVTVVYYETYTTSRVLVVSRDSADPGLTNVQPVPIDKGHIDICKPSDAYDTVYLGVKRHIQKALKSVAEAASVNEHRTWTEDYHERSLADRRDLLQKLIDAGREHEYAYANDARIASHAAIPALASLGQRVKTTRTSFPRSKRDSWPMFIIPSFANQHPTATSAPPSNKCRGPPRRKGRGWDALFRHVRHERALFPYRTVPHPMGQADMSSRLWYPQLDVYDCVRRVGALLSAYTDPPGLERLCIADFYLANPPLLHQTQMPHPTRVAFRALGIPRPDKTFLTYPAPPLLFKQMEPIQKAAMLALTGKGTALFGAVAKRFCPAD